MRLDDLADADADLLTKIYEQVAGGLMPPDDAP